jgi:hypothetical protein
MLRLELELNNIKGEAITSASLDPLRKTYQKTVLLLKSFVGILRVAYVKEREKERERKRERERSQSD